MAILKTTCANVSGGAQSGLLLTVKVVRRFWKSIVDQNLMKDGWPSIDAFPIQKFPCPHYRNYIEQFFRASSTASNLLSDP